MCLAIPLKIISLEGVKATVASPEHTHENIDLSIIPNPKVGEYVFVHGEIAVHRVPEDEAIKIMGFINAHPHAH